MTGSLDPALKPASALGGPTIGFFAGFFALGCVLLLAGDGDHSALHLVLDAGVGLLSVALALLFLASGRYSGDSIHRLLAASFLIPSLLELPHVLVAIGSPGAVLSIRLERALRATTWAPSAYLLPVGIGGVLLLSRRARNREGRFWMAMIAAGILSLLLFYVVPLYSDPIWLGVTRPALLGVPVLWILVGAIAWGRRSQDRIFPAFAFMAVPLFLAHLAMLYSRAPDDTPSMIAHLGEFCGYFLLLFSVIRLAALDIGERLLAEQRLSQLNDELKRTVKTQTARFEAANQALESDNAERRRAAEALTTNQLILHAVVDNSEAVIYAKDLEGRYLLVNRKYLEIFHLEKKDIYGKTDYDLFDRAVADAFGAMDKRVVATDSALTEEEVAPLDDGMHTYLSIKCPLRNADGAIVGVVGISTDITERKKAENAVRAGQERYRLIFDQSPLPKWVYDLETLRFVAVNKIAQILYGYSEAEFLGMTIRDIRPPADVPALELDVAQAGRGGTSAGEWRHLTKDGRILNVVVNAHDLELEGRRVRLVAVQDITERRQAETQLRQSEERFRALVTASSDVIYQMNPDWTEMRHLQGRNFIPDTDAPSGSWLQRYIHPKDQALVVAAIGKAIQERTVFVLEHQVVRVDGTLGWTFSRAVPLFNERGEITEWFGAASDTTARKHAEARMEAQLVQLNLLNQITKAIGEHQDLESIFQVVVRSLEESLAIDLCCMCVYDSVDKALTVARVGLRSEGLAAELDLREHARIQVDENGLSRCVRGELVYEPDITEVAFSFPQRLAKGGLRSLVFTPLLVEGKVFGVIVGARRLPHGFNSGECEFLRQLSEHAALAANQAQLHASLQRAYDDLRQTQQAVLQQERLRALGQMASGIAHDVNNAISPAALYVDSLLEQEPSLTHRGRKQLEIIQHALDDVAQTIARMREFYRNRETQLTLAPVDLNQVVRQVSELTRARWHDIPQQRGIVIDRNADLVADLPSIQGDESEIREALTNLIFNAVDAMPEGGTLTLRTRVLSGSSGPQAVIEVVDTGMGMDGETRRRCLEPFFTTKGERGTGLGLAMVYGMVKRHSANIEIESTLGKGTLVRLSFAVPVTPASVVAPDAHPSRRVNALRLLIIDDDPLLIKSLKDILEIDGHLVVTAGDGRAGIEAFRAAHIGRSGFAAVITDLGMPHLDGRRVAAEIKGISPVTPVILLTGWGQRMTMEADIPPHVDLVLAKPPKLRELREALAECCAGPSK